MAIVRELDPADAAALAGFYEEYPWWDDREGADVRAAIASTEVALCVVERAEANADPCTSDGKRLLAAARVLTDYRYYATVYDVIVAKGRRGEGLGEQLLEVVVAHPDLQDVPGLSLLCREGLVPFYESIGFELYDPEMDVPEGGTEELVRMTYTDDEE